MISTMRFTEKDCAQAWSEWGCNCGPTAFAFALGLTLDESRQAFPLFAQRRYVNVAMMRDALRSRRAAWTEFTVNAERCSHLFVSSVALVRIQFGGPWIIDGKPARWASTATHWVATWRDRGFGRVFDVNSGPLPYLEWAETIVPAITKSIKRCDGRFWPTHIWRIDRPALLDKSGVLSEASKSGAFVK